MLEIKNLNKNYHTGKKALINVNLEIQQGEIVGIFGENGAGKTTLMKCILGLLSHKGEITLDGSPISSANISRLSFATSEHSFFPNLSANGHKAFYKMHFPKFREKRFNGLMTFFELPTDKPIKQFSTGQKNQFEVILSLSQGADYILMDEPFAGNDVFNREDFYKVLLGILDASETILLSTHLLEEVEKFISRAVLVRKGEILKDVTIQSLDEAGKTLMGFVKESYQYKSDRVVNALSDLTDER